jgi:hypothetical protein
MEQNKQNATHPESTEAKKPGIAHRVGDAVEKLGDKVEHSGLRKVGGAIGSLGDKIEHSQDSDKGDEKDAKNEPTKIGLKN